MSWGNLNSPDIQALKDKHWEEELNAEKKLKETERVLMEAQIANLSAKLTLNAINSKFAEDLDKLKKI